MKSTKSFIEKELERERSLREKSSAYKLKDAPTSAPNILRLEHIMTPNEIRHSLGFPTISDEPQSVELVLENKLTQAKIQAAEAHLNSELLYTAALDAMRIYGNVKGE